MWQICISADAKQEFAIDRIYSVMKPMIKSIYGVCIKDMQGDRPRVSIACEKENSAKLEKELFNLIVDIIMTDMKMDYIKSNSSVSIPNKISYNAYLKALVLFDRNYERGIVERRLILSETLTLDGLLNFRLSQLTERWEEICKLATISNTYICTPQTYIDLLVFLVGYLDSRAQKINIISANDGYELIVNQNGEKQHLQVDKYNLMSSIIEYNPEQLEIDSRCNFDKDNLYLLDKLYKVHSV